MEIYESPTFRQWMLDKIAQREFQERTGIHQSDLVFCLNKSALRRLKPLPTTDEEVLLYSIGWATQRWLTGQEEDEPEIEKDGIIVTLDATTSDGEPWELKATYQSANKDIQENIHWIRQLMAQCYVTGKLSATLSRFGIMGDWKWVFGKKEEKAVAKRPQLHAYRFVFTQQELDDFWVWMRHRKKELERCLEERKLRPPVVALASGMSWECNYCPYNGRECTSAQGDVVDG